MKYPFCKYVVILIFCFLLGTANAADVIVKGVGANRTIALSEAFKEAVRQGIGTYIESSTIVRNDEIIKDNIIELAYGYVENYKVLSESQKGKTYHIRIQANVSNEAVSAVLSNILPANTLTEKDREKLNIQLDSEISAQINQHLRATRKAAIDKVAGNICRKIFDEYRPAFSLVYEFIPGKIQVTSATENYVTFNITGVIRTNQDLYNLLVNSLITKFERVMRCTLDTVSGRFKYKPIHYHHKNSYDLSFPDGYVKGSAFAVSYNRSALKFYEGYSYQDDHDSVIGNVSAYHLNNLPFLNILDAKECKTVSSELSVYLADKKGNVIYKAGTFSIMPFLYKRDRLKYEYIISPYFKLKGDHELYSQAFSRNSLNWSITYTNDWTVPCLERNLSISVSVPLKTARRVAGIKGFLHNNSPEGELLLNQLLKGGKK